MKICKPERRYRCNECEKTFLSFQEITEHRLEKHKNVVCDICEKDIHFKNIKRHMKKIHAGQTPARYEMFLKQKQIKNMETFNCTQCSKCFTTKGNLTNHNKSHTIKCDQCELCCKSLGDLNDHKLSHMKEKEKQKIVLTLTELELILEVHELMENILAMAVNRGQEISLSEVCRNCETKIKTKVNNEILKATERERRKRTSFNHLSRSFNSLLT
jgi:DNA-directed RNA polymerase subunit RPC12/RpoP